MSLISNWKEKIERYFEIRINLVKIGFIERGSRLLSYVVFIFLCLSLLLAILLFAGLGSSEFFASVTDSRSAGYYITTGIYLLLLGLLFLLRKNLLRYFGNIFVSVLTEGSEEEEKEETDIKSTGMN